VIQATLTTVKARKLAGASLAQELSKLPTNVWTANQQHLARTVRVKVWGDVSLAYSLIRVFSPTATHLPVDGAIGFLQTTIPGAAIAPGTRNPRVPGSPRIGASPR
jgi:hypothetical protein